MDNDPIVLARALLVSNGSGRTAYLHADLREPERILADPVLTGTLDLNQPVGLIMVAITHPGHDFDPEAMEEIHAAAQRSGMTVVPRIRAEVARFFADWEIIEPGIVPVAHWRPETVADPQAAYYWAGIARKL